MEYFNFTMGEIKKKYTVQTQLSLLNERCVCVCVCVLPRVIKYFAFKATID